MKVMCKCGKATVTSVSSFNFSQEDGKSTECYAHFNGKKWVKGCSDNPPAFIAPAVDILLDLDYGL